MVKNKSRDITITQQQQRAIQYLETPLLIVAGPGTGKTKVLTEKVNYLVENKKIDPNRILVSTFTIKAADELKERLRKKLGDKVEGMHISTIHSFCKKMLLTFPEFHNFGNVFDVLDELDQFLYINKNFWSYGLSDYVSRINVEDLINFYNKCSENNVDSIKLVKYHKKKRADDFSVAVANSYNRYLQDILDPNDTKLDFSLLQREFYHLLIKNPEVLNTVRKMFDYILVDEYQDTNPIQDAIFRLISEPNFNFTAVGDEDQSIYGFRGASLRNFREFLTSYPNAVKFELEENFRSNVEIVSTFEEFMKEKRVFEKKIFTKNPRYSDPILIKSTNSLNEAINVRDWIIKLVNEHNVNYRDIAILFKSVKLHSLDIVEKLDCNSIPYIIYGDGGLLRQEDITDFIILMSYINSCETNVHFVAKLPNNNILNSSLLNFCEETIKKLIKSKFTIFNIKDKMLSDMMLAPKDLQTILNLRHLRQQQRRNQINQLKLFYRILDATNFHYHLVNNYFGEKRDIFEIRLKNLAKLSNLIHKFEKNVNSKDFKSFFYYINKIPDSKMEDSSFSEELDAVKLMTIHQAKGLEFPIVILPGVTNRRYNTSKQQDDFIIDIPKELMMDKVEFDRNEELQRTFYVGLSRAKKILTLSTIEGRGNKPSKFIDEIGEEKFISYVDFSKIFTEKDHLQPVKEKRKLSYSSISAFLECPFRFYMRDQIGFQTPIDYFQKYGVLIHNVLKKLHLTMKKNKTIKSVDIIEIVDLYCKDDESRLKWRDELINELLNYVDKIKDYFKEIIDVELPFSYIDSNLIVNGQVDLVIRNTNDVLEIIDFKSRYKEGLKRMNIETQLRIYNIALRNHYSENIESISAYTLKDNYYKNYSNNAKELEETISLMVKISNSIESNKFERNWNGNFCDTKAGKCEFYQLCKLLEENAKK